VARDAAERIGGRVTAVVDVRAVARHAVCRGDAAEEGAIAHRLAVLPDADVTRHAAGELKLDDERVAVRIRRGVEAGVGRDAPRVARLRLADDLHLLGARKPTHGP